MELTLRLKHHQTMKVTGMIFENVVTNGTFDADSNWTKGTNWSISNGKAVGTSTTTNLQQLSILEVGIHMN